MEKAGIIHLSTACISKDTADKLNEAAFHNEMAFDCINVYAKSVYGWFVYAPMDDEKIKENVSQDIRDCFELARKNECEWIAFDRDVEFDEKDNLKKYSW